MSEQLQQLQEMPELRHYLVAGLLLLELIVRLQPSEKDLSIFNKMIKINKKGHCFFRKPRCLKEHDVEILRGRCASGD
jgi:hypothetical protein